MSVEQEMMRLASERSRAMELAAAAGRFLAAPEGADGMLPLKKRAEETLDAALAVTTHHTNRIMQLKEML